MDSSKKPDIANPRKNANILSKILLIWIFPLLFRGSRKGLNNDDLTQCLISDNSELLGNKLDANWRKELANAAKKNRQPKLRKALFETFICDTFLDGFLCFLYVLFRTTLPLVLAQLLIQFQKPNRLDETNLSNVLNETLFNDTDGSSYPSIEPTASSNEFLDTDTWHYVTNDVYCLSTILCLVAFFSVFFEHHAQLRLRALGARMRIACCSLVYRKTLLLSKKSSSNIGVGYLINLISNDVGRFDFGFVYAHYLWVTPLQACFITYFIWRRIKYAAFVGVFGLLIKTTPVQITLSHLSSYLRLKVAERTDKRVGIMNEIIQGIQVIKMYSWEIPFAKIVAEARRQEIQQIRWASYIRGINLSIMVFIERSTLFITLLACVLLGQTITADIAFSMAQYFNALQLTAAIFCSQALILGSEALISIQRVEEYLLLEERDDIKAIMPVKENISNADYALNIKDLTAFWDLSHRKTLDNINMVVKPGQLCAIIGPVGSGKSSLLHLLLGELPIESGKCHINGNISYASQEPWLFTETVRANILFGEIYNKERYNEVVKCCALVTDFKQLPNGDKTIVGERGASLSGGQRARISLARAVYKKSTIYLLDDPLSAVDAHVGKHLFNEVIGPSGYLSKTKSTRLLVTHQVHFLKDADIILILDNGAIIQHGTYNELADAKLDFGKLLEHNEQKDNDNDDDLSVIDDHVINYDNNDDDDDDIPYIDSNGYLPLKLKRNNSSFSKYSSTKSSSQLNFEHQIHEEEQKEGGVKLRIWRKYFGSGGNCLTLTIFVIIIISSQLVTSCSDYFVNYWTQQEQNRILHNVSTLTTKECVWIYALLIIGVIIMCLLRSYTFIQICMHASKGLHNKMFAKLLATPVHFFDTNPSGRILNRFSKDMGAIDEMLPRVMMEATQILLVMAGIFVMVAIVNPFMIAILGIALCLFSLLLKLYLRPSQDLKRLEGITRSPVFSYMSATLMGISTIRSRGLEGHLAKEFDELQNVHSGVYHLSYASITAFGLWLDILSTSFVAVLTFSFLAMPGGTSSGNVGLAISQALILTGMVQYGIRQMTETMLQMTSVERVIQYTDLEQEVNPSSKPPKNWPQNGQIQMDNMSLRYDVKSAAVLKNLQINIDGGWKVGIVGRTGAGKSSLISAIFRLAPIDGKLLIDDIDTGTISLDSLRSNISIIPQEPVLFTDTIRNNLDPFNLYKDDSLWQSLNDVELKSEINSLDYMVTDSGTNFSVGQRQLICLARAILRNNKILVLDEATANVDPQTDNLIQNTIRIKFKHCTVLTIAHRLHTVMDSDRILVMDDGYAKEFDYPHLLLQNNNGILRNMVDATGQQESIKLKKIAESTYTRLKTE